MITKMKTKYKHSKIIRNKNGIPNYSKYDKDNYRSYFKEVIWIKRKNI